MSQIGDRFKAWLRNNIPTVTVMFMILLLVLVFYWNNIFVTIHSGEAGVMYRRFFGGTIVDKVYSEGFNIVPPWDKLYVYNVRIQEYPYEFSALTSEGLTITFNISIRYQPEYETLGVLHQRIGPDYVKTLVVPEVEATLRELAGQIEAVELYTTKQGILQKVINKALEQVSQRFVRIDDVLIKNLKLPEHVQKAVETKMEQRELAKAYEYKLEMETKEAERKRIEAEGIRDYNKLIDSSLTSQVLKYKGIDATTEISKSENAKVVVIGNGDQGLPIILGADR